MFNAIRVNSRRKNLLQFQRFFSRLTPCGLHMREDLPRSFDKVLIANRGEIACRVMRTCAELDIKTVAVYSDADANSLHVQMADEAYHIGPSTASESYLDGDKILEVAQRSGAQAVHPGYGFLSENSIFCEKCDAAGVEFIGPPIQAITQMGSKSISKRIMEEAGVPVVPGYYGADQTLEKLQEEADKIGYPLMIKAVLGGGGKGMRVVNNREEFFLKLEQAKGEAMASFSDDVVLLERYIVRSRHVEFQVFGDKHGNAIHFFERDCSIQRRNQKILEESPCIVISEEFRNTMGQSAVDAAKAVGYVGAGTVEFILDCDTDKYYFMEMNTRLQVEHPVTEMVTRQDLVQLQLHVAAGHPLPIKQNEVQQYGHAIEARIYAESTQKGFLPSSGKLKHMSVPESKDRVRIETGVRQGDEVTIFYDPMIAKLVVWGEDRKAALRTLDTSLNQFNVFGLDTNIDFLKRSVVHPVYVGGDVTTSFIAENENDLMHSPKPTLELVALSSVAKTLLKNQNVSENNGLWQTFGGFRLNSHLCSPMQIKVDEDEFDIKVHSLDKNNFEVECPLGKIDLQCELKGHSLQGKINGKKFKGSIVEDGNKNCLFSDLGSMEFNTVDVGFGSHSDVSGGAISPMPGKIIEFFVTVGQKVNAGDLLCLIEAMKMRHEIRASSEGSVLEIMYGAGDFVGPDVLLVQIE